MRILLDHNMPIQLADVLVGHQTLSARSMFWDTLRNGDLLAAAEETGFDVMITADKGIFYQQNNSRRKIALVVVNTNYRPSVLRNASAILDAVVRASSGSFEEVEVGPSRAPRIRTVER
jgi:predicted nuclease of predicted toxin-antitoxin system